MENVLKKFGLRDNPFTISPDPQYLFFTPQHTDAAYQCQYTIEKHGGLAVIYGDVGTGKTTIARTIWQKYYDDPQYKMAMMVTPDLKTETAFLRGVMAEYGVSAKRSFADSMAAFRSYATKAHQQGQNIVLLVDEAQQMTSKMIEVIRIFMNFESNDEKFIQVILFGQSELATMIDGMRAIKSRVSVFGSLTSLTDSLTEQMIAFRWGIAGGKAPHPFNIDAIQEIFKLSQGLPREINKLCSMSLLRAFISESDKVHPTMVIAAAKELRMKEEV